MVNHRKRSHSERESSKRQTTGGSGERSLASRSAEMTEQMSASVNQVVGTHPAAYVMTCFGLGVGIGIVIGHLLAESSPMNYFHHRETATERLGRNILDAVAGVLPESLAGRLHR
jgi:hypothetical protein